MGRDYAGIILENTDKGLVLSQVECKKQIKENRNRQMLLWIFLKILFI